MRGLSIRFLGPLFAVLALGPGALALTVDNFEEGDFQISDAIGGTATRGEQSGLLGANVVGGVRLVFVNTTGTGLVGSGEAALQTTPGDDGVAVTTVGADLQTILTLVYDGVADELNTGVGGTLGLNLTTFTSVVVSTLGSGLTNPTVDLTLVSSVFQSTGPLALTLNGDTVIPLSGFTNLNDIRTIRLSFGGVELGDLFSVTNIDLVEVPEPGTALLMAVGLAGLAARRRRAAR